MSFIVKGVDLPIETDYLRLTLFRSGRDNEVLVFDDTTNTLIGEAIQIPKEHGAIKDINTFVKDKSMYEYIENDVFNKKYSYCVGLGAIYNAPTILEAEE